jgi:hypothetical protein
MRLKPGHPMVRSPFPARLRVCADAGRARIINEHHENRRPTSTGSGALPLHFAQLFIGVAYCIYWLGKLPNRSRYRPPAGRGDHDVRVAGYFVGDAGGGTHCLAVRCGDSLSYLKDCCCLVSEIALLFMTPKRKDAPLPIGRYGILNFPTVRRGRLNPYPRSRLASSSCRKLPVRAHISACTRTNPSPA